ncbi:MAG TPA: ABC transporter permease [Candidatus Paceibacterota bacterium]|nr:ABC transporter permease [Candidatus Paceibacterota bacterium]
MRAGDAFKLSTRMFKTNPARTWLTVLGMGVGTSAVVMLVGLGFGLQNILLEKIVFGDTLLSLTVSPPSTNAVVLDQDAITKFKTMPDVLDVSPLADFQSLITYNGLSANTDLQGVKASYFKYAGIAMAAGQPFSDDPKDKNNIILSSAALQLFGVEDPKDILGKNVSFRVIPNAVNGSGAQEQVTLQGTFTVTGVTNDVAAIYAMIPLDTLSAQIGITSYSKVQVRAASSNVLNTVQTAIIADGYQVSALSKTVEQANQIFGGIQIVLAGFGGIALIVSAIGMFNTMTVTLLERTGEIGVMRTIGASPRDIQFLFLAEAVVVGFLGGMTGMGIGIAGGLIINYALNVVATHFGGTAVALFAFPGTFLLFITCFSAVVGFITGIFPARRASSISPLEAIRYK